MKLSPQQVHEAKLTLEWLEKETPEQWAVGLREDAHGRHCILGHLDTKEGKYHRGQDTVLDALVKDLPEAQTDYRRQQPGVHCLNNNLKGDKRKILDTLWALLKGEI